MPDFADSYDFLNRSTILRRAAINRQNFDPTNEQHLASLKLFIQTGNWGDVQFFCEFPFSDVPMTVLMKFAGMHLNAHRKTSEEVLAGRILAGQTILGSAADEAAVN